MKSIMLAPAVYPDRFNPPLGFVLPIQVPGSLAAFIAHRKTGCNQRRSPISLVISRLRLCLDGSKPQIAA